MKNITALLIVLSGFAFSVQAQEPLSSYGTWKDSASHYIIQLKGGALLVRLHSRAEAISKLRGVGSEQQATLIENIQREENKQIVEAFRSNFSFCKVYFFFADSTDVLLSGKHSGFLLNDSLQVDHGLSMKDNFFMIAEKGNPHLRVKNDPTQPNQQQAERSYLNETIVLLDDHLKPLKAPFPFYAQEPFPTSLGTSNWKEKVRILNARLHSFYKKSL
ncbi:MAG: hypothetical protein ABIQ74_02870 [Chitinophagales bacterium]